MALGQVGEKKWRQKLPSRQSLCIWNPENRSRVDSADSWWKLYMKHMCLLWFFSFCSWILVCIYKYLQVYIVHLFVIDLFIILYITITSVNWSSLHTRSIFLIILYITITSANWSSHKEFFPLVYCLVDPQTNLNNNPPPLSYTLYL